MTIKEIAARIDAHLKAMEADPEYNLPIRPGSTVKRLYLAYAAASGSWIIITYVGYQGSVSLRKRAAEEYLVWLDAGNKGQHYKVSQ